MRAPLSFVLLALVAACGDQGVTSPATPRSAAGGPSAARTEIVTVAPGSRTGWIMQAHGASKAALVAARDGGSRVSAPSRSDALGTRLHVGTGQADGALIRTERFAGTPLSELTALGFSTYVEQRGRDEATPILTLAIDLDGDGYVDDHLLFRPMPALGEWQEWDALRGGWWSNSDIGSPDAHGIRTLAAYRAAAPGARLAGALTIGAWDVGGSQPLVAEVDRVVVGTGGRTTLFRFGSTTSEPE